MLAETYVRAEGAFPLIGAGGIDSGAAALAKIRAGAWLVQLYTGLVFRGLGLVAEIKRDLVRMLRDSGETLADLVGTDAAAMTAEPWPDRRSAGLGSQHGGNPPRSFRATRRSSRIRNPCAHDSDYRRLIGLALRAPE